MAHRQPLALHHEVLLLALRNDRGTLAGGVMFAQAAGGAILAELLMSGSLRSEVKGRSTYVVPGSRSRTGDDVLDECLRKVLDAKRRAKLITWVQRFAGVRRLRHRVATALVDKGILREDEGRVLLLFTRRIYPELDPAAEKAIISRLDRAIFGDGEVDPRTTVLLAIAHHTGLLKTNFDKKRLKARKVRIAAVTNGDAIGKATKEAVAAVQAAVAMAAIMPAVIAASSAH